MSQNISRWKSMVQKALSGANIGMIRVPWNKLVPKRHFLGMKWKRHESHFCNTQWNTLHAFEYQPSPPPLPPSLPSQKAPLPSESTQLMYVVFRVFGKCVFLVTFSVQSVFCMRFGAAPSRLSSLPENNTFCFLPNMILLGTRPCKMDGIWISDKGSLYNRKWCVSMNWT